MAGKFIELKEAAEQLGISPDRLLEMRDAGEIHGYRDGSSWKFKPTEVERVAGELGAEAVPSDDVMDFSLSDSSALSDDDFDSLLNVGAEGESEVDLEGGSSILISEETGSEVDESSSSTVIGKNKKGKAVDEDSDLKLEDHADEDDELKLSADSLSEELELSNDLELESDDALSLGEDSELSLADGDDELELDVSSGDALGESDSGISLAPSDSGLSLESQGESSDSLELPEDDDMISLEDEIEASPDDATQLKQDEEFLLSPSDEMLGDESSDSGSQVIALEDSEAFEDEAAIDADEEPALLADDSAGLQEQLEPFDGAALAERKVVLQGTGELPEAAYSVWNVLGLLSILIPLGVTGMLMTDVIRNMWSWNGSSAMTTSLMDFFVGLFHLK